MVDPTDDTSPSAEPPRPPQGPILPAETEATKTTESKTTLTVRQKNTLGRFAETLDAGGIIGLAGLLLIGGALWLAFSSRSPILAQLQEQSYARGLITFIFTLGTLGIAITLVGSALFSTTSEDGFRRAREVFSVLAGVLGTIVGFYFGSTGREGARPTLAPVRLIDSGGAIHLSAYVGEGGPPYEYDLDIDKHQVVRDKVTKDGWIFEDLGSLRSGFSGELRIIDSKGQAVEASFEDPRPSSPSPPVSTPATTLPPSR